MGGAKTHPVRKRHEGSILNITLAKFISHLNSYSLCIGITVPDSQQAMSMTKHIISKKFNFIEYQTCNLKTHVIKHFAFDQIHVSCCYLMEKIVYKDCNALKQRTLPKRTWKSKKVGEPAKPKAPITLTSRERLKVNSVTLFFSFLNRNMFIFLHSCF